jgi:signal transduction histidine kinase
MQLGDRFVRELAARFDEINQQFNLLNWIDREIIESGRPIESTVADILKRSMTNFRAKAASAFVVMDKSALPFPQPDNFIAPIAVDQAFSARIANCHAPDVLVDEGKGVAWLVLPISISGISSLRIVLAYETPWYGGNRSHFHDDDMKSFAEMVTRQSAILISKKIEANWHRVRDDIEDAYFAGVTRNDAFSVERRWLELVRFFKRFLPNWPPLQIDPEPQIQILTYDGNRETILLRAGTAEKEPRPAKSLYIKDTICGLLIEHEEKKGIVGEPLYVDPTADALRSRYKAYLLDEIPRSELVLPIRWAPLGEEKKTIALVNLEHARPGAFSKSHIEILSKAVELITPYAAALIYEEVQQRARDIAHIYLLHGILAKMAITYRHKIGQRITAATLSLEALEQLGPKLQGDEKKFFERLSRSVLSFAELSESFVSELPNYVRFGKTALFPLVEAALGEFDPAGMKKAEDITMTLSVASNLDANRDLQVFGSPLIREHVYSILNNSVEAVRNQLNKGQINEGLISVIISNENQTDKEGEKDSFPFVVVQIEDNGGGLLPEAEKRYGEFGNTIGKAGGSGFGVAAAREYLLTIGGAFVWENFDNKDGTRGLRQKLCFPFYVNEIHIAMATRVFGQPNNAGGNND